MQPGALAHKKNETDSHRTQKALIKSLSHQLQDDSAPSYGTSTLLYHCLHALEQNQKELHESKQLFDLLVENATDVISRHDPQGRYLYVSPSAKIALGYEAKELLEASFYKFLHYDDVKKMKNVFHLRKESSAHQVVNYRIRRKEGDYRWFESNIRIIYDEETKAIREIQAASRDITDRVLDKKARLKGQQLARVSRLSSMEEMASGMAHEISQPLAAVVNYTQGCVRHLQGKHYDVEKIIEVMKKAAAQAQRAGEVIHRLKSFFCKGELIKTSCKINSLVRETVTLIRNELNLEKVKVEFFLSKNVPVIFTDKIQIQQVLLNLIQNAMDAMKEIDKKEKRIRIHVKSLNVKTIEIVVNDSGPGFSKDMVNKAFEPFVTTKTSGRGMGLAICRSIVEAHGGKFTIYPNTHYHSGIRFVLPIH